MKQPSRFFLIAKKWGINVGLLLLVAYLLVIAVKDIALSQVLEILLNIKMQQIWLFILINFVVLLLFSSRWWLILRLLGFPAGYLKLSLYRLASFGVSYFTPGPQFGGEPFQVLFLKRYANVSESAAVASVGLDRILELTSNFIFLLIGLTAMVSVGWLPGIRPNLGIAFFGCVMLVLIGYLAALMKGVNPIGMFLRRFLGKHLKQSGFQLMVEAESDMSGLFKAHPIGMFFAVLFSILIWMAMFFEYWMLLGFFDLGVDIQEALIVMTAARLAFLTPLPGGVGALEASQVWAMDALNLPLTYGLGVSLIIRLRDVMVGLFGLGYGYWLLRIKK